MTRDSENHSDTGVLAADSSPARLAAEAAFRQRPINFVAKAEPQVVVIKRRKAIVPAGAGDPTRAELPEPSKEARTPRVFRVDTPIVGAGPAVEGLEQAQAVGASADFNSSVGAGALPAPVVQDKRSRRRIPRAEVTIIRPAVPTGPVLSAPAHRHAQTLKRPEPCFAARHAEQDLDLGIATSFGGAPSRYQTLKAQIEKLEQRAEATRKVEAAQAARWIKRAIVAYGLGASDLGL